MSVALASRVGAILLVASWARGQSPASPAFPAQSQPAQSQPAAPTRAPVPSRLIVVQGAAGSDEYRPTFRQSVERWRSAAERGGASVISIGDGAAADPNDRETLKRSLAESESETEAPLWLVLIGHGTYDGKTCRFNLRGPDLTAEELAEWLRPHKRPMAIVVCASASAPFLNALSAPNRVVITATRAGSERSFSRFGEFLAQAIADPKADLDKDERVSLLEAFLSASASVRDFYANAGRLATEHPLLEDNGDRLGVPADWFQGTRATKSAKSGAHADGQRANQWRLIPGEEERTMPPEARARRDELERIVEALRERKSKMPEDEYFREMEAALVELARLCQRYEPTPPKSD